MSRIDRESATNRSDVSRSASVKRPLRADELLSRTDRPAPRRAPHRAALHDLAVVHDRDRLRQIRRLRHVVRDEHHALPELAKRATRSSCSRARTMGSSAPSGSSSSSTSGSSMSARMRPTRCRSPPESSRGNRFEQRGRGRASVRELTRRASCTRRASQSSRATSATFSSRRQVRKEPAVLDDVADAPADPARGLRGHRISPCTVTVPRSGATRPTIIRSSVDFPQPLGPISASRSFVVDVNVVAARHPPPGRTTSRRLRA